MKLTDLAIGDTILVSSLRFPKHPSVPIPLEFFARIVDIKPGLRYDLSITMVKAWGGLENNYCKGNVDECYRLQYCSYVIMAEEVITKLC